MKKNSFILAAILALMAVISLFYSWKQDTFTYSGEWTVAEGMEERVVSDEYPRWTFSAEASDRDAEVLSMPLYLTRKGTYTLVLDYTDAPESTRLEVTSDPVLTPDNEEIRTLAVIPLPENPEGGLIRDFTLPCDASGVTLRLVCGGSGTVCAGKVYVQSNFRYYLDTLWILLFAAALVLPFVKMAAGRKGLALLAPGGGLTKEGEWLFVLAAGFLSSLPVLKRSLDYCVDLQFHLMRIMGLSAELSAGNFPFRLQSVWIGGRGYPVGWYYPDLIILLPAVMTSLGASLYLAYKLFVVSISILTAHLALYYGKKASGSPYFGLFFSAAYTFSLYRLMNLYSRGDPAESAAMAFLPMLLYGLISVIVRRNFRDFPLISVPFALILGSHLISAVLALFLCLFFAAALIREFTDRRVVLGVAASAVTAFLLGAHYLLPLLQGLGQPFYMLESGTEIEKTPVDLTQLFTLFPNTSGGNILGSSTMEEMSVGVGFLCGLGLLLYAAVRVLYRKDAGLKSAFALTDVFAAGALLFTWISTPLFPWKYVRTIPLVGGLLVRLQFAWRFNGISTVLLCVLLAAALDILRTRLRNPAGFAAAALAGILVSFAPFADNCVMTHYPYMNNKYEWALDFENQSEVKDYLYSDLSPASERAKTKRVLAEGLSVTGLTLEGMHLTADISTEKQLLSGTDRSRNDDFPVELPLLYYPGYSVTLDGRDAAFLEGEDHALTLIIPAEAFSTGEPVRLDVRYRGTPAERAGILISLAGLLGLVLFLLRRPSSIAPPPEA